MLSLPTNQNTKNLYPGTDKCAHLGSVLAQKASEFYISMTLTAHTTF